MMATADAIRGYIVTLRRNQDIKVNEAVTASGLQKRGYLLWEKGTTEDIKAPNLLNLLSLVGGWAGHLPELVDADEATGIRLAEQWLGLPKSIRDEYNRLISSAEDRVKIMRTIATVSNDPEARGIAQGYLERLADERRR